MLIEFSVTNFRSFRERQTLSMIAAPRLRKKDNAFVPDVLGEKLPPLLKVAAVYGPNASGKSNLLQALCAVSRIASASPTAEAVIPVYPFRFDASLAEEPSRFELHFVSNRQRYQFELAATQKRIVEERLIAFPKGKETLIYKRVHTPEGDEYAFPGLEGGDDLHQTWRRLTGPTTLFISQVVANSSEDLTQLRPPFAWLREGIFTVLSGMRGLAQSSRRLAKKFPLVNQELSQFLRDVDVPVTSIKFEEMKLPTPIEALERLGKADTRSEDEPPVKTTLTHKTALGEADFKFEEESEGTRNLIGFWLPWSMMVAQKPIFNVFAVDELDSSLHPEIVADLVEKALKFENPMQLIFTTHDTHLMDTKLLRRDQIWITERDVNGATQLRSIYEFDGRESEDIEKRYYEGRYRGLPIIRRM